MGTLNDKTIEKCETIKNAGYNHVSTFECQLAKNKDFQKFAKNFTKEVVEPINPKDSFYGGRTNATKLPYNVEDNECGRYVDFCSLYPTVQSSTTKNTRLVTPPDYSAPKSMTNLGTVLLNAK